MNKKICARPCCGKDIMKIRGLSEESKMNRLYCSDRCQQYKDDCVIKGRYPLKLTGQMGSAREPTWNKELHIHTCCKAKSASYHKLNCQYVKDRGDRIIK